MRDGIVFIGVAQEKAQAFQGKKVNGRFEFTRDKAVYVNHYYFGSAQKSDELQAGQALMAEASSVHSALCETMN